MRNGSIISLPEEGCNRIERTPAPPAFELNWKLERISGSLTISWMTCSWMFKTKCMWAEGVQIFPLLNRFSLLFADFNKKLPPCPMKKNTRKYFIHYYFMIFGMTNTMLKCDLREIWENFDGDLHNCEGGSRSNIEWTNSRCARPHKKIIFIYFM